MVPPGQEATGPPCRPVCGASRSPNGPLSHILSEVLNAMADQLDQQVKTECRSTEELVVGVEVANGRIKTRPTVFSMDVKALYPSLKAKVVAKEVSKVFLEQGILATMQSHSYRFHGKTYLQSYRSHYLISGNFSSTFSDTAKNSGIF